MNLPVRSASEINVPEFLSGGGEMGERIRSFNWANTPLGHPQAWPQSLKTCVRIMLASRQPIWLGWGKQLIKLYNDPYISIVGGKHPEALGEPASVVWKDIWTDIDPMLKQVMEKDEGTYVESQLLIMERNGYPEETYYTFSYTPVPGDDGRPAGMICANTDDTERIIGERQLKTLRELSKNFLNCKDKSDVYKNTAAALRQNPHDFPFALLYEIAPEHVHLVASTEEKYAAFNIPPHIDLKADHKMSLLAQAAIQSDSMQLMEGLDQKPGSMPKGAWGISPEKALILPITQSGQNKTYGLLIIGLNPYRLLDEKYHTFFSLVVDQVATALSDVFVQQEERKRAEALAEIDRAKTAFFTNISHEFRTPLTLMLGSLEELLNKPAVEMGEDNKEAVETTHRNAMRLLRLVNNLLDFSRIEAGKTTAQYTLTDIARYTIDLASTFRSVMETAGLRLQVNCEAVYDPVYVDRQMWEKIVLNLLSNAFKYTMHGTITVSLSAENGQVVLKVIDTGVGIPESELPKMFHRFHRVENVTGRTYEGSGIGLSLVKELVQLHGGNITVASQHGKGSEFRVSIPTGKEHLPADQVTDEEKDISVSLDNSFIEEAATLIDQPFSENGNTWADTDKATILVVDDNADMRSYFTTLLKKQYRIVTASNGLDAVELLKSETPELIITDVMMPVMNGIQLLQTVKNDEQFGNIPVILVSARAGEEAKIEGYDIGADDYLVKPFSAKELLARVNAQINISQKRKKIAESEKKFRNVLLESPNIFMILHGLEMRIGFVNKPLLLSWGKNWDIVGKTLMEVLPELKDQPFPELLEQVYTTGEAHYGNEEKAVLIKNGVPVDIYYNYVYQPIYDEDNNVSGITIMATDITEQVIARQKIETSEKRFRTLAETLPQLVWITNEKGEQEYASSRWDKYSGIPPSGADTWAKIVHPDDLQVIAKAWTESMVTGSIYKAEARLKRHDGEYRWHFVQAEPIRNTEGSIVKWIGAFTDIHEQKTLSEKLEALVKERTENLKQANLELQRSNDDLQQFAHVASHDLKEPVRKVRIFTNLLEGELDANISDKAKTFLSKIEAASARMYAMIEGVLLYSSLDAANISKEQIPLAELIGQAESDLEIVIEQKNALIQYANLPVITGSKVLLEQLFYNLINNALKFSHPDRDLTLAITAEVVSGEQLNGQLNLPDDKQYHQVTIRDNGIGFEQAEAEKIFKTFTRLHSKDKYEGTGLGLALCKKIVELHNGAIIAKSRESEGASFIVLLPVKKSFIKQ